MDLTRLSWASGGGRVGEQAQQPGGQETKMSGLDKVEPLWEGHPSPWAGELRAEASPWAGELRAEAIPCNRFAERTCFDILNRHLSALSWV